MMYCIALGHRDPCESQFYEQSFKFLSKENPGKASGGVEALWRASACNVFKALRKGTTKLFRAPETHDLKASENTRFSGPAKAFKASYLNHKPRLASKSGRPVLEGQIRAYGSNQSVRAHRRRYRLKL